MDGGQAGRGPGRSYLSVHQEPDGQRHVQAALRLDLDGLHLWLDMRTWAWSAREGWSQLMGDLSTPG